MKKSSKKFSLLCLSLVAVLLFAFAITAFAAEEGAEVSKYYGTYLSLLAPVIAIVLALITKEVYSSLFVDIY